MPASPTQSAPAPHWHDGEPGGHVVQFYADDSFLLESLSKFIGTALVAGDASVVIATQSHLDGLAERLASRALSVRKAARESRYIPLDAAKTLAKFMRNGHPDSAAFAATMGPVLSRAAAAVESQNSRVVAFGEMVALLWADGNIDAAIKLEQLWNDLSRQHAFSLRCAYPITGFCNETHAAPFLKICSEHSAVIPGESYTSLASEQDRLRNIAQLQQKAEALETEKALLQALRQTKDALEREVAERRAAQRKLRHSELSLRELSAHLLRTQDEERRRLGRELHDTVGQYLAVLKMGLDSLNSGNEVPGEMAAKQMSDCLKLVDQSIKELRTMSYLLYPPMLEEMGLKTAILWYVEGFAKRSGIDVQLDISPALHRLPRELELAAFRVLQESLTNVHRHSGSSTAQIRLRVEEGLLLLEIKDSGKGMPPNILEAFRDTLGTMGVGLRGMNERVRQLGGTLALLSDGGTTVRASLPCAFESFCS
ncbi:MAG: domain S-box [Candidatus Acidoferrum typicum]|nr:domain S-box [Candidatus Acidoferrum typicum]